MITVLRIGHRPQRDKRVTTHVALVARAFGAKSVLVNSNDPKLEATINAVSENFGGDMEITTGTGVFGPIKKFEGLKVHLTMYGVPLSKFIEEYEKMDKDQDVLLIVGAEKVPRQVYEMVDHNVAVSNQPHSEIAALALILDRMTGGAWEDLELSDGKFTIIPDDRGKNVVSNAWVPTPEECIKLNEDNGVSEEVIAHQKAVAKLAKAIAFALKEKGVDIDVEVVEAGALLHDIGRAVTHGPLHAMEGAAIVDEAGVDKRVVACVLNHIGAGLEPDEARSLGLPETEFIPLTIEEKVIAHSDNLNFGKEMVRLEQVLHKCDEKQLDRAAIKIKALHEELEGLLGTSLNEFEVN